MHVFPKFGIWECDGTLSRRIFHLGGSDRGGIHLGCRARPLLSYKVLSFEPFFRFCALRASRVALSCSREEIRGLCGDDAGALRPCGKVGAGGAFALLLRAVRGDACGARCACPALFAPSLARGAASVCRRGRPRDEGHFLSQHAARTRAPVLCLRSERRGARASARGKGRGLRRDRLCRDERPPARARPNGCGRGDEIPALLGAPLRGRDGACGLRDPAPHLCGGNERLHRGDALPLCDAHLQALSVCRGARDPDFSRFLALSAVYARGCAFRRKNRREGRRALRGFPALADGICGDRAYSVSLGRVFGVDVFSGLYSLRSPFRAAPQGNTSPPRAGTECRWNSSRGRA